MGRRGAVVGNLLQWLVPPHDLADAKGVITTVQGVVSALLAIVLGLLIWTSYGVFTQQQSEAATLGAQLVQFDVLLDRLGPEGARGRGLMRRELIVARKRFWGDGETNRPPPSYADARAELGRIDAFFASLKPAGETERTGIELARSLSALDRADASFDGEAVAQSHPEGADRERGPLGDSGLLLRRPERDPQRAHGDRRAARRRFSRERDLSHPRVQPALPRPFPHLAEQDR